jgi:hypothetical protein
MWQTTSAYTYEARLQPVAKDIVMKQIVSLFSVVAIAAALGASTGCTADTAAEDEDLVADDGDVEQDLKGKYQYAPTSARVRWEPGCGMRRPDGTACQFGLFLDYTPKYADLAGEVTATWDSAGNRVVVRVETSSASRSHTKQKPTKQTVKVNLPNMPVSPMAPTTFRVVDYKQRELSTTTLRMIFAP